MDLSQLTSIKDQFVKELEDSASGKSTSLPFIIHHTSPRPLVSDNEIFQVMTIGGSVFKKALVKRVDGQIQIINNEEKQQPVFITKEDLLKFVALELDPNINILALNFAYPLTPTFDGSKLDGILLTGSKENHFEGLLGERVGDEIQNYVKNSKGKKITVSCANDTVCLLLSGLTHYSSDQLACGIVGTGMNFAFFLAHDKLVNLESANFDKFVQSEEGKIIDQESMQKGKALFEKEVAGAYLFKIYNLLLKKRSVNSDPISSTIEMENIIKQNIPQAAEIAKEVLEHSASLIACQIAGILSFKKHNMVFVMEGSLFWKSFGYKQKVEEVINNLCSEYKLEFIEMADSTILGAAKLVS